MYSPISEIFRIRLIKIFIFNLGLVTINLGLSNDFALRIIQEVGNYEEIYHRNLGPSTLYNLDRGPNKAWNKGVGGVLSSPPFR